MEPITIGVLAALGGAAAITVGELAYKGLEKNAPSKPNKTKNPDVAQSGEATNAFLNVYLHYMGKETQGDDEITDEYAYDAIKAICRFLDNRFDCSDFRIQLLIRIYKDCNEVLSQKLKDLIKTTCLNFKYFMDEPGHDSMCYWSENHQVLFASAEYLVGQQWPDDVFTNSGLTGKQHMEKAKIRIERWTKQRFEFGFSEFLSNVYIVEDLGPMANFIDFCEDEKLRNKMKMAMDLLWFDIAIHTVDNRFAAASSRMYAGHKSSNSSGNSCLSMMTYLWGKENLEFALKDAAYTDVKLEYLKESMQKPYTYMMMNFIMTVEKGSYELPKVIKDMALLKTPSVAKMSAGLSIEDMVEHDLIGPEPHQIMAQWGAETFTQHQAIRNTISYVVKNKMNKNSFISYFKLLNFTLIPKCFMPWFAKHVNLMTHGIALGRGNVYSYKNKHFALTTTMASDVDACGTQEHIWSANIAENLNLYTTHPSRDDGRYGGSPGYWIGNGRRPMSVQDENVNITIYKIPKHFRAAEFKKSNITHAYMPQCFYDEFELCGDRVFARRDNVLVAMISNGDMKFRPYSEKCIKPIYKQVPEQEKYIVKGDFDLVREGGQYHAYVTELSSLDKESFEEFKGRINDNKLVFSGDNVEYVTGERALYSSYSGEFKKNDEAVDMNYLRYDNEYCKAERSADEIVIKNGDSELTLNYKADKRIVKN